MSDEIEIDIDDLSRRMDGALASLRTEFASLRTGRASGSMLEPIQVDAYGQMTPINQLGTVNVPEPRMVTINVWDKGMVNKVEKAIRESDLGLNPASMGELIRVPMPPMSEERRKEMTKLVRHEGESAKVAIRNLRRDANDATKKLVKDKEATEDDQKRAEADIQKATDKHVSDIDALVAEKEKEIMAV